MGVVHFSISGDFITDQARSFWAESEYEKAFRILECAIGISKDQMDDIIQGRKKLTGVNDLDLVDDDWKPAANVHYPSRHEVLKKGESEEELQSYKEREAKEYIKRQVYLEYELDFPTGASSDEARMCKQKAKQLIGVEEYENLLEEYVAEYEYTQNPKPAVSSFSAPKNEKPSMGDWFREQEKAGMLDLSDPLTMTNVLALDPMFMLEKRMNMERRSIQGDVPEKESELFEKGWLLPNGDYYRCHFMEHVWLAGELLNKKYPDERNYEKTAEDLGWVKLTGSQTWPLHFHKKLTKKQCNRLWDYCEKFGFDYKYFVEEPNERR